MKENHSLVTQPKNLLIFLTLFIFTFNLFSQNEFITTWKTDNPGSSNDTSITIPTTGAGYNYDVDWDNDGVFNFEGGCYAKTIDLSKENEPDIYGAIKRDALLENVSVDANGKIDFTDGSATQNTRVSYPINHIANIVKPVSKAGHATKVIFLTADAFGVMPPVSKLTPEQTKYHFLSGFTAKLAEFIRWLLSALIIRTPPAVLK